MNKTGYFYTKFRELNRDYSRNTFKAAEDVVAKMLNPPAAPRSNDPLEHPGVLLGKVQSGKTRTFVTLLTLAFDNGYDLAIVFTKNSRPLLKQTLERLQDDLKFFDREGVLTAYDIMQAHERYAPAEFNQKLIFVCKKEDDNLKRLKKLITDHAEILKTKKVLFIDDEGDTATVSYRRSAGNVEANVVTRQISEIRGLLAGYSYLSVTATPYSLYLQPTNVGVSNVEVFKPVKPLYTVLAPVGDKYIGGDVFFRGHDNDAVLQKLRPHLHIPVTTRELERLRRYDGRTFPGRDEYLTNNNYRIFRQSLVNFLVGGAMIRIPKIKEKIPDGILRYAFVIHTEMAREAHNWQITLSTNFVEEFKKAATSDMPVFLDLLRAGYNEFNETLKIDGKPVPTFEEVVREVKRALGVGDITITKVNSENELISLLDQTGQLKLRVAYNIFVGGQVMDRGVTIGNLIGFFYGRRPQKAQTDTVIQHQRMYGYRREEISVTRLYTTPTIHQTMTQMEEFDHTLREAVKNQIAGGGDGTVHFIRRSQDGTIVPCSPNKVLASETQTLRPGKRILPIGFQSGYKTRISKIVEELDNEIGALCGFDRKEPILVPVGKGVALLQKISKTLEYGDKEDEAVPFDWTSAVDALAHLSQQSPDPKTKGKIWIWAASGRKSSRFANREGRSHATFIETPDSTKTEGALYERFARDNPILFLLRQEGQETNEKTGGKEWRGTPFYWPVIRVQLNAQTAVYATEVLEDAVVAI
jgi:hypothetical protein